MENPVAEKHRPIEQPKKRTILQIIHHWLGRLLAADNAPAAELKTNSLEKLEALGIAPSSLLPILGSEKDWDANNDINVQFFGPLQIRIRDKTVPQIRGRKNASVLAYLLLHHSRSVHRDVLIDKFWSDVHASAAKNSLHVAICSIRKSLARVMREQEVILYENESYCINPELEVITDVEKFLYFWKKGRAIEAAQGLTNTLPAYNKAVALYQREFLENLGYENWCESERSNLREIYLFILNRLSTYFFEAKNYYACINVCNKMLATDECLEEVHRKLMRCYDGLGVPDMAFKQFFKCKKVLEEELGLEPSQPTVSLFAAISGRAN